MAKRKFIDFQHLKDEITIEQVLSAYGVAGLHPSGAQLRGPCPIHEGSNDRQFVVWPDKGTWRCFGECQKSGDIIQLVALLLGVGNFEAAQDIAKRFDLMSTSSAEATDTCSGQGEAGPGEAKEHDSDLCVEPTIATATGSNVPPPNLKPLEYLKADHPSLKKRGINTETAAHFGAGFASRGIMAGRIAIPIHTADGTDLLAYAGAATREDQEPWKFPKDFRPDLEVFNVHRLPVSDADAAEPIYVTFDPFFVLQQHRDGNPHTVAILSDEVTDRQLDTIATAVARGGYRTLIVAVVDRDEKAMRVFDHFASQNFGGNVMLLSL